MSNQNPRPARPRATEREMLLIAFMQASNCSNYTLIFPIFAAMAAGSATVLYARRPGRGEMRRQ